MNNDENKRIYGREELKKYFRNGYIPSENHYGYLIESMINKQDDGISRDEEHGLHIFKSELSERLITFFDNLDEGQPFFTVEKDEKEIASLKFSAFDQSGKKGSEEENSFFFHEGGKLGIGQRCTSINKLEVKGFVGMEGRVGTYKTGTIPADGTWHPIIENLDNCQAFEILARSGDKGKGKFSIMHAIALSTYGHSKSKIRKTRAHYGIFLNKLNIRWKANGTHDYHLQLRTNCNYGDSAKIFYSVTKLWDDETMLPDGNFYAK